MMSVLTVAIFAAVVIMTAIVVIFVHVQEQAYAQIAALPKNYKFEDYTLDKVLPKSNGSSTISTAAIPSTSNMTTTAMTTTSDQDVGTKIGKTVSGGDSQSDTSSTSSSEGESDSSSSSSSGGGGSEGESETDTEDGGSSRSGGDLFTNDDNDDEELGDLFE
jgi:uncharacterized membrane protein YgcG